MREPRQLRAKSIPIRLADWLTVVSPGDYGLPPETPAIDAFAAFVTTGDGRAKARQIAEQYNELIASLPPSPYRDALQQPREKAWALVAKLYRTIEGANWLECEAETRDGERYILVRRVHSRGERT